MRCMLCDAEMMLMNVVQDDTMPVPGFERRTFMCSSCHDVEQQLAFVRPGHDSDVQAVPANEAPPIAGHQSGDDEMHPADTPSIAPISEMQDEAPDAFRDEHSAAVQDELAPGLFRRVVAKMRGR
jgi:hypothetical protein